MGPESDLLSTDSYYHVENSGASNSKPTGYGRKTRTRHRADGNVEVYSISCLLLLDNLKLEHACRVLLIHRRCSWATPGRSHTRGSTRHSLLPGSGEQSSGPPQVAWIMFMVIATWYAPFSLFRKWQRSRRPQRHKV